MIGPITNSTCIFIGGILGALFSHFVPQRMKDNLPLIFGIITACLGTVLTGKVQSFPVVVLSIIIGASCGEIFYAEFGVTKFLRYVLGKSKRTKNLNEGQIVGLITLISAFCFSSMGIFGSINEGVTGNPEILLAKAVLDFFTAVIFGSLLGGVVSFIAVPQFVILCFFYSVAFLIMPLMNDFVLANFTAVGGIIFTATGLRMCNIKIFPVINMVPALAFVISFSVFWEKYIQGLLQQIP